MDTQQTWKGLNDGVTCEWTLFAKVKPGHEKTLLDWTKARISKSGKDEEDKVVKIGTLHDSRWVFFDNGTRVLFTSNFDGDWGQYIDDFFATGFVEQGFDGVLAHCEGYSTDAPDAEKKKWFQDHTQEAVRYTRTYHGTAKEMRRALEVDKAFQQVLDNPAAAKALADPALKPLLDLAAH